MNDTLKYTLRKFAFLVVLAALIASPFAVQAYKSATTTDPYILMAREIEAFSSDEFLSGEVDVVSMEDQPNVEDSVAVFLFIDDYLRWSERITENFNRYVMEVVRNYGYENLLMVFGWDVSAEQLLIQRTIKCTNLRVSRPNMCEIEVVPGVELAPRFIKWPGIGNP